MRNEMSVAKASSLPDSAKTGIWTALIVGASILFSMAFACAAPFAGLAAAAGIKMQRRDALTLVVMAWLANQAIGFFVLGYPRTYETFAWGVVIGVAAVLAASAASECKRLDNALARTIAAFFAAFIAYEGFLYAITVLTASSEAAYSLPIVARIFEINGLAFAGLLVLHRLAMAFGLTAPRGTNGLVGDRA